MSLCSPARVLFALILVATFATPLRGDPLNPCELGGSERPDEGAIGGTGARLGSDEGAIGGTGARPDEGGVGGTGRTDPTRVGVIGTVTGFASICIGRVEVHYTSQEGVQRLGGLCKPAPLKRPSMLAINRRVSVWFDFLDPAIVRGYGEDHWIRYDTGNVVAGSELTAVCREMLSDATVAYVHIRSKYNSRSSINGATEPRLDPGSGCVPMSRPLAQPMVGRLRITPT
jgi:hypothetical protein